MRAVITIFLLSLLSACSGGRGGNALFLERIDSLTSVNPAEAAALLDSIDPETLSEKERHHRDLLVIKAADKAYHIHTSDSLILDVIDYYTDHPDSRLTPQALYYGGRVYSDLGDYPTALRYFQDALDRLPDNDENLSFRGTVMSQTGRLLEKLRLYSQAIPYIEGSIEASKIAEDSFYLAYDHQLLGATYLNQKNLPEAKLNFEKARKYAASLEACDRANIRVYEAITMFEYDNIDSALCMIRNQHTLVDSTSYNLALICAAQIYRAAGISDTAYAYAQELAMSPNPSNRRLGYNEIFSPELIKFIPEDSIVPYIKNYHRVIEDYFNTHEAEEALMQNSLYNYTLHVKKREEAEASKIFLIYIIAGIIIICSILGAFMFYKHKTGMLKYRLRLNLALTKIDELKRRAESAELESISKNTIPQHDLGEKSTSLLEKTEAQPISTIILNSGTYQKLRELIKDSRSINTSLWDQIEAIVEEASPGFNHRLVEMTNGTLTNSEFEVALLVKCGITPSQMCILLNKAKSTISSRRNTLGEKILGEKASTKDTDHIIKSL